MRLKFFAYEDLRIAAFLSIQAQRHVQFTRYYEALTLFTQVL